MTTSSELARVAQLRAIFSGSAALATHAKAAESVTVQTGIGDDAAVLALTKAEDSLVWTIDAQVDGTHFRLCDAAWEDIGWRSFMAAASDLAAMGASPVAALSALVLNANVDDAALAQIARGQAEAAHVVGAHVIGGNMARGRETSITTTLLGTCAAPLLRSGAKPGDTVWLAGPVGLAGAGFAVLERFSGEREHVQALEHDGSVAACLRAWRRPVARIAEGLQLTRNSKHVAHAAIDISDGLAHDAWQLALASDVHLVLDAEAILATGEAVLEACARIAERDALELALYGGEDYALLATVAPNGNPGPGFVAIGTVETARGDERLSLRTRDRAILTPLAGRGFDHFAESSRPASRPRAHRPQKP